MQTLELIVLCGFLGSGKTTLLAEYLQSDQAKDTAVIVNEVGKIDIDGAVVAACASVPTVMLSNGCVCCSIVNELTSTIEQLCADRAASGATPFGRIVVECSGLSTPGPILRSLARLSVQALNARVVSTFDAQRGADWLHQHREVAPQLAAAHTVVLTKLDLANEPERALARQVVVSLNPLARVVDEVDTALRACLAFEAQRDPELVVADFPTSGPSGDGPAAWLASAHGALSTWVVRFDAALPWDDVTAWLDDLTGLCGERLLRLKGFVKPIDVPVPLLLQSVGTVFSEPRAMRPEQVREHGLVLITRDLDAEDIRQLASDGAITVRAAGRQRAFYST